MISRQDQIIRSNNFRNFYTLLRPYVGQKHSFLAIFLFYLILCCSKKSWFRGEFHFEKLMRDRLTWIILQCRESRQENKRNMPRETSFRGDNNRRVIFTGTNVLIHFFYYFFYYGIIIYHMLRNNFSPLDNKPQSEFRRCVYFPSFFFFEWRSRRCGPVESDLKLLTILQNHEALWAASHKITQMIFRHSSRYLPKLRIFPTKTRFATSSYTLSI